MIRKSVVLITGAGGEIGHGLIAKLAATGERSVITLDVNPLETSLARQVQREFTGSILDHALLERIMSEFEIDAVFHLAALLSTRSEFTPITAHQVNVEGTLSLLEFAQHEAESHGGYRGPPRQAPDPARLLAGHLRLLSALRNNPRLSGDSRPCRGPRSLLGRSPVSIRCLHHGSDSRLAPRRGLELLRLCQHQRRRRRAVDRPVGIRPCRDRP